MTVDYNQFSLKELKQRAASFRKRNGFESEMYRRLISQRYKKQKSK